MAPSGIADTTARAWPSSPMQFRRITRPTSLMEGTASSSVTARSTMAAKTLSKPITPHTFGVASTLLLACNVLSTLDTIVTAVPCLYPLSGFIWSSKELPVGPEQWLRENAGVATGGSKSRLPQPGQRTDIGALLPSRLSQALLQRAGQLLVGPEDPV